LLRWLADNNLREPDEPTELWFDGQLAQTQSVDTYLTNDPPPNPFAPQGTALHRQVHELLSLCALPEALDLAQQLLQMHPDEPVALVNVATILEGMGRPVADVIGYYRQAHALAPDHVFALCGLAICLTSQGDLPQARALLHRLHGRPRWHFGEYSHFMRAQHALAVASGQHESARDLKATMDEIHRHFSA
jgi:Flp pilus assembly protein TadD